MLTGFHGTTEDFETFSEDRFGSVPTRSPNGALGVWIFTEEGHAEYLGGRVLQVEVDALNPVRYPLGKVKADHFAAGDTEDPVAFFRRERARLLALGHDLIEIEEKDGRVAMAVILDLERIVAVTELTPLPAGPR